MSCFILQTLYLLYIFYFTSFVNLYSKGDTLISNFSPRSATRCGAFFSWGDYVI